MTKTISIKIPEWIDEKKLKDAIIEAISKVTHSKEISIEEFRKILKIKPEELKENIEIEIDIKSIREKEKKRLP